MNRIGITPNNSNKIEGTIIGRILKSFYLLIIKGVTNLSIWLTPEAMPIAVDWIPKGNESILIIASKE